MRMINADLIQYEPMLSAKGNGMYEDVMVAYKSQIDDLPAIEERKKGKWKWHTSDIWECSECGHRTHVDECMELPMYEWCPYCGADMRGDDHEND